MHIFPATHPVPVGLRSWRSFININDSSALSPADVEADRRRQSTTARAFSRQKTMQRCNQRVSQTWGRVNIYPPLEMEEGLIFALEGKEKAKSLAHVIVFWPTATSGPIQYLRCILRNKSWKDNDGCEQKQRPPPCCCFRGHGRHGLGGHGGHGHGEQIPKGQWLWAGAASSLLLFSLSDDGTRRPDCRCGKSVATLPAAKSLLPLYRNLTNCKLLTQTGKGKSIGRSHRRLSLV